MLEEEFVEPLSFKENFFIYSILFIVSIFWIALFFLYPKVVSFYLVFLISICSYFYFKFNKQNKTMHL